MIPLYFTAYAYKHCNSTTIYLHEDKFIDPNHYYRVPGYYPVIDTSSAAYQGGVVLISEDNGIKVYELTKYFLVGGRSPVGVMYLLIHDDFGATIVEKSEDIKKHLFTKVTRMWGKQVSIKMPMVSLFGENDDRCWKFKKTPAGYAGYLDGHYIATRPQSDWVKYLGEIYKEYENFLHRNAQRS